MYSKHAATLWAGLNPHTARTQTLFTTILGRPHFSPPCATLDISDTGNGIPPDISNRIFDSFLSGRPDGTGLGRAIAKRILISHRGDIALASTGPEGTTMRITLPLAH